PEARMWRAWRPVEPETGLAWETVFLARVARAAARHDVLPRVRAAARTRDHVVDVLGRPVAVLATVTVAREHRAARQRHPVAMRHPHEVDEPDHRGHGHDGALGVELGTVALDHLGLLLQHEDDRSPNGHDAQRLEAGIQQQRSTHGVLSALTFLISP